MIILNTIKIVQDEFAPTDLTIKAVLSRSDDDDRPLPVYEVVLLGMLDKDNDIYWSMYDKKNNKQQNYVDLDRAIPSTIDYMTSQINKLNLIESKRELMKIDISRMRETYAIWFQDEEEN